MNSDGQCNLLSPTACNFGENINTIFKLGYLASNWIGYITHFSCFVHNKTDLLLQISNG